MLSIMIPMIGIVMVNRRTSMVGDALSHTSLAGVAAGLIMGWNPVLGATIVCVLAAFGIEGIRRRFPHLGDMATAVIMSTGLGLAAVLTKWAPGGNNFENYLFGSISAVSLQDVIFVAAVFVPVVALSVARYGALLDIAIDPNLARIAGVRVRRINAVFTLLTAITVALACKIVGALLVASLLVLPVATALIAGRSYRATYLLSIALGVLYTMGGIVVSYVYEVPTGGAIVLAAVLGMLIVGIYAKLRKVRGKEIPHAPQTDVRSA